MICKPPYLVNPQPSKSTLPLQPMYAYSMRFLYRISLNCLFKLPNSRTGLDLSLYHLVGRLFSQCRACTRRKSLSSSYFALLLLLSRLDRLDICEGHLC
jgi:hypothetical protein